MRHLIDYFTILCCAGILLASLAGYIGIAIMNRPRHLGTKYILAVCFTVAAAELIIFNLWPVPHYRFDSVQIKALNTASVEGGGKEVFLTGETVRGTSVDFPEVESGHWFWHDGMLCWRPPEDPNQPAGCTDTVVLKVPVGEERRLTFSSNCYKGLAEITACGQTQVQDTYSEGQGSVAVLLPGSDIGLQIKDALLRIAVYTAIHAAVFIGAILGCKYLLPKMLALLSRRRYEAAFFAYATMMVIRYGPLTLPSTWAYYYNLSYYVNGYEFGFINRGLVGQLALCLTPSISQGQIMWFLRLFTFFAVAVIAMLLGKVVRRQKDEALRWLFVLIVCTFPSNYMFVSDALRPDIYVLLLFILCAVLIYKNTGLWAVTFSVLVIMLINETSCFYTVPPVLAMLLYKWTRCEDRSGRAKLLWTLGTSLAVTVLLIGLKLVLTDPRLEMGIDTAFAHMRKHFGFALTSVTNGGPFYSVTGTFRSNLALMAETWMTRGKSALWMFALLLPAYFLLCVLRLAAQRKWTGGTEHISRAQRICFWLMPLSTLPVLVPYILSMDTGRYVSVAISEEIVLLFWVICEEKIQLSMGDLSIASLDSKPGKGTVPLFPAVICIYYALTGVMGIAPGSWDIVNKMITFTSNILK